MNSLYKKNILITGGCGFIGSALVRKLLKNVQCNILNIDKYSYSSEILSIEKLINLDKEYYDEKYKFEESLFLTVKWYIENQDWLKSKSIKL